MTSVAKLLAVNGIKLDNYKLGEHYRICPKCSPTRAKKNVKCLGIKIDAKGVCWRCNHCGWAGPEKGEGEQDELITYDYVNEDGDLLFQKVRLPPGSKNRFYCRRPNGNGRWINNTKDVRKPLYRWKEIIAAKKAGREIAIAEGEKDCDALWRIDIPATCNFDGAADVTKPSAKPKWKAEYSEALRGAALVVFNDNDQQGYAHADAACRMSLGVAKRVRRLDLKPHWAAIPKGGDVSDWLAAGGEHTPERLRQLIEAAPDYVAPQGETKSEQTNKPESAQPESAPPSDDDVEIERLARLKPLDYEKQRKAAAEKLEVRASILDKLVQAERTRLGLDADDSKLQGRALEFPEPELWPEPVVGAALLNALAAAIRKHVVMSYASSHVAALWVLHTWLIDCFVISPRLCVRSATKGCGKTLLLDVIGRLVRRPLRTLSITPAATFRIVEGWQPTLLIDEADTFLNDNEGLRGILDGNRKGDTVTRTVGDQHEVRVFATYSAVTIALIGVLPDTLHDRSVVIELKRRLPKEKIAPFRFDRAGHLDVLARMAARWAADNAERVGAADPDMGIINREGDNWRPLAMVASVAGGRWPARVAKAASAAHVGVIEGDAASELELLLGDIRDALASKKATMATDIFGHEQVEITSAALVATLVKLEGRPWPEMGRERKPMTANRLARMLKPIKIKPVQVGPEDARVKGYRLSQFAEAFDRYLEGGSQPLIRTGADEMGTSSTSQPLSPKSGCEDAKSQKPAPNGQMSGWPDAEGGPKEEGPVCAFCGRPGGNPAAYGDEQIRLHRECEQPFIDRRMREEGVTP